MEHKFQKNDRVVDFQRGNGIVETIADSNIIVRFDGSSNLYQYYPDGRRYPGDAAPSLYFYGAAIVEPKIRHKRFYPCQPVLVCRDGGIWRADIYSSFEPDEQSPHECIGYRSLDDEHILPLEGNEHLWNTSNGVPPKRN